MMPIGTADLLSVAAGWMRGWKVCQQGSVGGVAVAQQPGGQPAGVGPARLLGPQTRSRPANAAIDGGAGRGLSVRLRR